MAHTHTHAEVEEEEAERKSKTLDSQAKTQNYFTIRAAGQHSESIKKISNS